MTDHKCISFLRELKSAKAGALMLAESRWNFTEKMQEPQRSRGAGECKIREPQRH
jgi:hypothetical protein